MLELRPLTPDDVEDAVRLSTQAGWNQVPTDWERLLTLCPDGCFAGTVDGELVATTTVVSYNDEVSWIGMVLVDEDHRSRGYGSQIFERGLEHARDAGDAVVGLDATHLGEPIYRKYGFETVAPVYRWEGTLRAAATLDTEERDGRENASFSVSDFVERVTSDDVDDLCAFDRRRVGADRSSLHRELIAESNTRAFLLHGSTEPEGYAFVRPGRTHWQLGPVVADEPAAIEPLFRAVAAEIGECDVIVDAPEREPVTSRLESAGLSRVRELVRMTYPEPEPALFADSVRAITDFAFG